MPARTGEERVTRLTELQRNAKTLIAQLRSAKTPKESRLIVTTNGKPVAVLQEYKAYQDLLELLEKTQRNLQIAETRERLRQMNAGQMAVIPLDQVLAERSNTPADDK